MSVATTRRWRPHIDFTHHLWIPLVTKSSRPQLLASFARFEQETSAIIPKGSLLNPEYAKVSLGNLKLKLKERISACSEHLHNMPVREMLRAAAVSAMRGPPRFSDLPYPYEPPSLGVASKLDYSPLTVDISGMLAPHGDSSTNSLSALVVDRTYRLEHFKHLVLKSLYEAGFLARAHSSTMKFMLTKLAATWVEKGVYDPIAGRWKRKDYKERRRTPSVDASDLIQDWKDLEWATNVQLEKICIYNLGIMEPLPGGGAREKQIEEVDSIMLPLSHESSSISKSD